MRKPIDVTSMEPDQTAQLDAMMTSLFANVPTLRYVTDVPTADTISHNELVVYDNGAGTKRLYTITSEGNLGYVALT